MFWLKNRHDYSDLTNEFADPLLTAAFNGELQVSAFRLVVIASPPTLTLSRLEAFAFKSAERYKYIPSIVHT